MSPVIDPVALADQPPAAEIDRPPPLLLAASVMVGLNEWHRYLGPFIEHLLKFCDLVCLRCETMPGANLEFEDERVRFMYAEPTFYAHEGRARQELVDFTLSFSPTHVLSIDADEFVSDGPRLRLALEADHAASGLPKQPTAWPLCMQEIWNLREDGIEIRMDGGWVEHDVAVVWTPGAPWVEGKPGAPAVLTMPDRALACGRIPQEIVGRRPHTCCAILHFGWTARSERGSRHARYVEHDGGRFHNVRHLDSILLPDDQIDLWREPWPEWLEEWRPQIEAHAGVVADPPHDDKGFSKEKCVRCGWVMGQPALSCQNDGTPHVFPSQEPS